MKRRYQMSAKASRDLAYAISRLPLPAPVPRDAEVRLTTSEPTAEQVERRVCATVPAIAIARAS